MSSDADMFDDAQRGMPSDAPPPGGAGAAWPTRVDELRDALRTLAESQRALMRMVEQQTRQNDIQTDRMETLEAELRREREHEGRRPLVDTKGLGKPTMFSGQITDWEPWCFKFVTGWAPSTLRRIRP